MIRLLWRVVKWLVALLLLLIVGLASPVAYVELACHRQVKDVRGQPVIADPEHQRQLANTFLTYPEWHIVYAYDGLAEVLKKGDEKDFPFASSVGNFWRATCVMMKVADEHGGADGDTRLMIHTIGVSFTLEMALKAAYEETVGRLFTFARGPEKTPQDHVAQAMAANYAAFLRQTPWYRYDFEKQVSRLWAAPVTGARSWERRLALGGEWKGKTAYAQAIAAGVAATGEAQLTIRSVIKGLKADQLMAIADVTVIKDDPSGTIIETPRYDRFTHILIEIAKAGGQIVEIAGNRVVMVSITQPAGVNYNGPGLPLLRLPREGFDSERILLDLDMMDLTGMLRYLPLADPGIEHVFDY